MNQAFICDAVRTPFGRFGGALATMRADDLAALPLKALLARNPGLDPSRIDDVIFGCANQAGEDNRNVARMALLLAGLPESVPGSTINRLCGSSLDAIGVAARAIKSGETQLMIAGGVESMSRAPFVMGKAESAFSRSMQLAWGWRTMFVVIGLAGIVVGLCWYVGYRNRRQFTLQEEEQQYLASEEAARPALKFSEWLALFKRRTTWGMILGFSGVNYTGWLYIAWLPGYLQAQQGLSLARTGWVAAIPFLAAAVGMWVNGLVVDALARRGYDLAKTRKTAIVIGLVLSALGTLLVVQSSTPAQAVAFISMALFCVHFAGTSAWGLVQVMVAEHKVASVAAIQNFGSFVFASFAPIVTGWVVDTTHSFNLALVIAAGVTFAGALCYFFIVKTRID
ncbi:TPA: MFS transporter [Klebsiella pneumoniae]